MNSELFWETKQPFAEKYGATFANFGGAAPDGRRRRCRPSSRPTSRRSSTCCTAIRRWSTTWPTGWWRWATACPRRSPASACGRKGNPWKDERLYDFAHYPADLYVKPGTSIANRAALAKWGAWVNAFGAKEYGRPLFIAASADLADSTNISGFAEGYGDFTGYGWYERYGTPEGVLLPQEITEFANAGILAGMATVNFAEDPEKEFDGFWGACSTYGSFSYLKYGMMRLFSQLAQDCQLKVGKVLWVAGHSGPETADDSRTHFGIFAPAVTQLFPDGHDHQPAPVGVQRGAGAAWGRRCASPVPIVALHLTRPPIAIPDRAKLGIPSHFEAARAPTWCATTRRAAARRDDHRPGHQRHGGHRQAAARARSGAG